MESAIAKYDHVVQCMRELKQIYRNAEMSETVLSPHKVHFTQSGLCVRSISRYLQKLPEVTILLQGDVETYAWSSKGLCWSNCHWSKRMSFSIFTLDSFFFGVWTWVWSQKVRTIYSRAEQLGESVLVTASAYNKKKTNDVLLINLCVLGKVLQQLLDDDWSAAIHMGLLGRKEPFYFSGLVANSASIHVVITCVHRCFSCWNTNWFLTVLESYHSWSGADFRPPNTDGLGYVFSSAVGFLKSV